MRKRPHKQDKKTPPSLRPALLAAFVFLLMMQPQKAHADLMDVLQMIADEVQAASRAAQSLGGQMLNTEVNKSLHQDDADSRVKVAGAVELAQGYDKASFGSGKSYCNTVNAIHDIQDVNNGQAALKRALQSATFWAGSGGGDVLFKTQMIGLLCSTGFLGVSEGCQSTSAPSGYADHSVFQPHSVTDEMSYPWPQVLQVNNGRLALQGTPSAADMPGLRAILFCAIMRAKTAVPVNNSTAALKVTNPETLSTQFDQLVMQGRASIPDSTCLDEVTKRLVIGPNMGGQLQTVYNSYVKECNDLNNLGRMSVGDFTACTSGTGVNYLTIMRAKACGYGEPTATLKALGNVPDTDQHYDRLNAGENRCDDFDRSVRQDVRSFADAMMKSDYVESRPMPDLNGTAR